MTFMMRPSVSLPTGTCEADRSEYTELGSERPVFNLQEASLP